MINGKQPRILTNGDDMNQSIWTETAQLPTFQPLQGDIKTHVLIIGGGIAGLLCAYHLQQAGADYILVEADRICSGITKNTTAKITSQHGLIYHRIEKRYGLDAAQQYLDANELALTRYRELCRDVDCDYQERPSYVYSSEDGAEIRKELETLRRIGYPAELVTETALPFITGGAIKFPRQAQFHPLKLLAAIASDLRIYEHTKVRDLLPGKAITNHGSVTADKVIVATHFPLLNKHGMYFLKMYQHRSYVIALENAADVHGMYVDDYEKGMSFRNHRDLLLIGGGDHRTGKKGGSWRELRDFAHRHYPLSKETAHWATQDCMTLDDIPYIGQYSKSTSNLYVATGFNKWGMSTAMAAGEILTDLVQGKENPYAQVFSPSRTMLHPQLLLNAGEAALNLLTPTVPRCPHMGCALKYNVQEHTWDCPCHGSRFTRDGKLIDNPATDDKNM